MELAAPGFGGVGALGRESTPWSWKRGVVSSPELAHSLNRWARTPVHGNTSILFFISFIPQPAPLFFSKAQSHGGQCQSILGNSGYGQFRIDCNPEITFLISRRGYLSSKPCTPIYTAQGAQCNTSTTLYASYSTTGKFPSSLVIYLMGLYNGVL